MCLVLLLIFCLSHLCCVPLGSVPSRKYRSIEVGNRISNWETREFCEHPEFRLGNTIWEIRVSEPNGTQH